MTYDLGASYRAARERIATLVSAHPEALDQRVPATPDWSVHDVLAHLAGVTHDAAMNNMAGAPGDAWTAAQVARGRSQPVTALLDLWREHAPGLEALLSGPKGGAFSAAVMDVHSHEADLRHALGLPPNLPAEFLTWAGTAMRAGLATQATESGLPSPTVAIDDFEWFRARLGRRTVDEVCAYGWSVAGAAIDPAPYVGIFFIFGRADRPLNEVAAS